MESRSCLSRPPIPHSCSHSPRRHSLQAFPRRVRGLPRPPQMFIKSAKFTLITNSPFSSIPHHCSSAVTRILHHVVYSTAMKVGETVKSSEKALLDKKITGDCKVVEKCSAGEYWIYWLFSTRHIVRYIIIIINQLIRELRTIFPNIRPFSSHRNQQRFSKSKSENAHLSFP